MIKRGKKGAFAIALTPIFILAILEILRDFYWTEQVFFWIRILFLLLITIPALLGIMATFVSKVRKSKWLAAISALMPIYYGFVIMLISFNRDILPQTSRWDISMTGLGVAIAALGIFLFMQQKQEPFFDELRRTTLDLNDNTKVLHNKLDKLEKALRKNQATKTRKKK